MIRIGSYPVKLTFYNSDGNNIGERMDNVVENVILKGLSNGAPEGAAYVNIKAVLPEGDYEDGYTIIGAGYEL